MLCLNACWLTLCRYRVQAGASCIDANHKLLGNNHCYGKQRYINFAKDFSHDTQTYVWKNSAIAFPFGNNEISAINLKASVLEVHIFPGSVVLTEKGK